MGKIRIDLNGQTLQQKDFPDNFREIRFSINPDINKIGVDTVENPFTINISDLTFSGNSYETVFAWRSAGFLFEGIPISFYSIIPGEPDFLIVDAMGDLTRAQWDTQNKTVTFPLLESGGIDWFSIKENNTTYELLATPVSNGGLGLITSADYIFVPYVISAIPNWREALIALIFFISLVIELIGVVQQLVRLIVKLFNVFEWTTILQIVIYLAYLVTLFLLIVEAFRLIVSFIIQEIKYHATMRIYDLLSKGCEALGLGFESPIFDDDRFMNEVWMPEKYQLPQDPNTDLYGFTIPDFSQSDGGQGYFEGSIGRFFELMLTRFNARRFVYVNPQGQKVLRMIRRDQEQNASNYAVRLPYRKDTENPNTGELISNYFSSFSIDTNDLNTLEEFKGTVVEVNERMSTVQNTNNTLTTGDLTILHPFALGKRKTRLTYPERIILDFGAIIQPIINEINGAVNNMVFGLNFILNELEGFTSVLDLLGLPNNITNTINNLTPQQSVGLGVVVGIVTGSPSSGAISGLTGFVANLAANAGLNAIAGQSVGFLPLINIEQNLNNRIGMLKLENDWINVPKIIRIIPAETSNEIKLDENQPTALEDYNEFYIINSFVASVDNPTGNQKIIDTISNVEFTCKDFVLLGGNFFFYDQDGNIVELMEPTEWDPFEEKVNKLVYKRSELHTPNMIKTISEGERR